MTTKTDLALAIYRVGIGGPADAISRNAREAADLIDKLIDEKISERDDHCRSVALEARVAGLEKLHAAEIKAAAEHNTGNIFDHIPVAGDEAAARYKIVKNKPDRWPMYALDMRLVEPTITKLLLWDDENGLGPQVCKWNGGLWYSTWNGDEFGRPTHWAPLPG